MASLQEKFGDSLKRELGLASAASVVIGEMMGVGIFLTPAGMARSLHSPGWLIATWLVMGIVTLAGALCFAELGTRYPEAGGEYVFLREAFGPRTAFLYGWMALTVMDPGLTSMLAVGISDYAGYLKPLTHGELQALALALIWVFALTNVLGARVGAGVLRALILLKLAVIALIPLGTFFFAGKGASLLPLFPDRSSAEPLGHALVGAMISAFFALAGWWGVARIAGEVKDPSRTLPRALVLGVSVATLTYILLSVCLLWVVPITQITSPQTFAAQLGEALFGRKGAVFFSLGVMGSVLGSLASVMLSSPRLYFRMARDDAFLPVVAKLHPRFGSPYLAIAIQTFFASILVVTSSFNEILGYFFACSAGFVALMIAAIYPLRKRKAEGVALTPGFPFTPLVFLVPMVALLVLLVYQETYRTLIGLGVVLLGIPVHALFVRQTASERLSKE